MNALDGRRDDGGERTVAKRCTFAVGDAVVMGLKRGSLFEREDTEGVRPIL